MGRSRCRRPTTLPPTPLPPDWRWLGVQGIVIFVVVGLTVVMNYVQARQTASVMAGFKNM
jgi:hypothetical protein